MVKVIDFIMTAILFVLAILAVEGIVISYKTTFKVAAMKERVLEMGDTYCSRMSSFDPESTGYIYTIKNGCEIFHD